MDAYSGAAFNRQRRRKEKKGEDDRRKRTACPRAGNNEKAWFVPAPLFATFPGLCPEVFSLSVPVFLPPRTGVILTPTVRKRGGSRHACGDRLERESLSYEMHRRPAAAIWGDPSSPFDKHVTAMIARRGRDSVVIIVENWRIVSPLFFFPREAKNRCGKRDDDSRAKRPRGILKTFHGTVDRHPRWHPTRKRDE